MSTPNYVLHTNYQRKKRKNSIKAGIRSRAIKTKKNAIAVPAGAQTGRERRKQKLITPLSLGISKTTDIHRLSKVLTSH
jgi:hypothetical protein